MVSQLSQEFSSGPVTIVEIRNVTINENRNSKDPEEEFARLKTLPSWSGAARRTPSLHSNMKQLIQVELNGTSPFAIILKK